MKVDHQLCARSKFSSLVPLLSFSVIISIVSWIHLEPQQSTGDANNSRITRKHLHSFEWSAEIQSWTLARRTTESNPIDEKLTSVWPEDCRAEGRSCDDRIVSQLMLNKQSEKIFKIVSADPLQVEGRDLFLKQECKVDGCQLTHNKDEADAIIFQNSDVFDEPSPSRRHEQVWIAYLLESPVHTFDRRFARAHRGRHTFNWTATYRSDSDIVAPYSKFLPFADKLKEFQKLKNYSNIHKDDLIANFRASSQKHKDLIRAKEGKVAWLASNCNAANNRLQYANELAKFIQVDVYGR